LRDEEGTIRGALADARDQTANMADQVKSATHDLYAQARDSASQVADAAGRSVDVARSTTFSLGDALRNTIESQPYTAVIIALGFGWFLGRMHRPL
jgi:ElaB/YqjD/DUF883 family membrane-anchored ribosome-binding protein